VKAAVTRDIGELSVEEIDRPEPLAGEVLVRMVATGVCHTDLSALHGHLPTAMPVVLGHEGAGVVEKVGPGVSTVKPGDHVVCSIVNSCGSCFHCLAGRFALCEVALQVDFGGSMLDGTSRLRCGDEQLYHFFCQSSFAEYAVVSARSAVPVRKDAPLEMIASLGCGAMTGIGAVTRRAQVAAGSSVVIIGAGGVGLAALLAARAVGASPIIVADIVDQHLELAGELGATHVVNTQKQDLVSAVQAVTVRGADYAFDAVGAPGTLETAFAAVRSGGEVVAIGIMNVANTVTIDTFSLILQKRLTGTTGGSINPFADIPGVIDLFLDGRLPLDRLVSRQFALEDLGQALKELESGNLDARGVVVF
jgi:Zn-dependent alcohol dehydrogenase